RFQDRTVSFGDTLGARVSARESQIVLGLDPDPMGLWPGIADRSDRSPGESRESARRLAADAIRGQCFARIDRAGPAGVAVKPQLARFEVLGAPGWAALEAVVEYAREAGLLVIADCKRGDIDVSARAYAQGLFGGVDTPFGWAHGLGVDMAT